MGSTCNSGVGLALTYMPFVLGAPKNIVVHHQSHLVLWCAKRRVQVIVKFDILTPTKLTKVTLRFTKCQ